jgi:hypothetical protein
VAALIPIRYLRGTPAAALSTLTAFAILAIVLAGQSIAACGKQMSVSMPGMDMPATSGAVMICPVIILLSTVSAALTIVTILKCLRDPDRVLAGRRLTRMLASVPITPASTLVAFGGATGIGLMFAVDGNAPQTFSGWLALAGIVIATALLLTLVAVSLSRLAVALGERLAIVIAGLRTPLASSAGARDERPFFSLLLRHVTALLSAGPGLRGPPQIVR